MNQKIISYTTSILNFITYPFKFALVAPYEIYKLKEEKKH